MAVCACALIVCCVSAVFCVVLGRARALTFGGNFDLGPPAVGVSHDLLAVLLGRLALLDVHGVGRRHRAVGPAVGVSSGLALQKSESPLTWTTAVFPRDVMSRVMPLAERSR